MKTLAVICARGESSLPDKNIALLNGRSVLWYSAEATRMAKGLARTILSTDSEVIARAGLECGVDVPFLRPSELAAPESRIETALLHALTFCEAEDGKYDAIVLLQNSSPLRLGKDIDGCLNIMKRGWDIIDSVATVHLSQHPHAFYTMDTTILLPYAPLTGVYRRQDAPKVYMMNGVCFCVKRDYLVECNRVIGERCAPYIMDADRGLDIHTEHDLVIAEALLQGG